MIILKPLKKTSNNSKEFKKKIIQTMIITSVITKLLNFNFHANSSVVSRLQNFETKIIKLKLPLFNSNLLLILESYQYLAESIRMHPDQEGYKA